MRTTGNTILITGGGSGIGAGLASALHELGNKVIIGGRREGALKSVCEKHSGMSYQVLDVADPRSVENAASALRLQHPQLNCLINNAGIARDIDFNDGDFNDGNRPLASLGEEIDTNIKGLVFMTAALLPLIRSNDDATIVNISSGLGFVPRAKTPVYCATKAAIHSFTLSLRHQLRASRVEVIEVAPPLVRTDLNGGQGYDEGPKPMEVSEFSRKTIRALGSNRREIAIGLAKMLRIGARIAPTRFFSIVNG